MTTPPPRPLPENSTLPSNSTVLTKPVDYTGLDRTFPSPAPSGPYGTPAPRGTSTLGDEFNGTNPNGTWSLYVVTDGAGDGAGSIAGGWSLTFTLGSEASTIDVCERQPQPLVRQQPGPGRHLYRLGYDRQPGHAGIRPVRSTSPLTGRPSAAAERPPSTAAARPPVATSFSTEADVTIQALYSGTTSFAESTGSTTQEVDNHTTVVAPNQFEDTGAITLNNPTSSTPAPQEASPYPSHIYVSNLGPVSGLTVTLNGISYPHSSDLDVLLVGPQGQSIVLLYNVGPSTGTQNASNVTSPSAMRPLGHPANTPLGAPIRR